MPESARPADLGLKPCAFWRNNEAEVPIAMPAKSRRLMAKLAPRKNAQRVAVGNIFSDFPGMGISVVESETEYGGTADFLSPLGRGRRSRGPVGCEFAGR